MKILSPNINKQYHCTQTQKTNSLAMEKSNQYKIDYDLFGDIFLISVCLISNDFNNNIICYRFSSNLITLFHAQIRSLFTLFELLKTRVRLLRTLHFARVTKKKLNHVFDTNEIKNHNAIKNEQIMYQQSKLIHIFDFSIGNHQFYVQLYLYSASVR